MGDAELGPIDWPNPPAGLDDAQRVLQTIMYFEEAHAMESDLRGRETLVSEIARKHLAEGAATSEETYRDALRARERLAEAFASWATPSSDRSTGRTHRPGWTTRSACCRRSCISRKRTRWRAICAVGRRS